MICEVSLQQLLEMAVPRFFASAIKYLKTILKSKVIEKFQRAFAYLGYICQIFTVSEIRTRKMLKHKPMQAHIPLAIRVRIIE